MVDEQTANTIWSANRQSSGELARTSNSGRAGEAAILDDYADLGLGLFDLFEATGETRHLERSLALATEATRRFGGPSGAWFLTASVDQQPLGRRMEIFDHVEPSGNSAMVALLGRLATATDNGKLDASEREARLLYSATIRERGLEMAGWLDAALMAVGPSYDVVVAGDHAQPQTEALDEVWRRSLAPWLIGVQVPATGATGDLIQLMPATSEKRSRGEFGVAYVCTAGSCKLPTSEPARLRADAMAGWSR